MAVLKKSGIHIMYFILITMLQSALNERKYHLMAHLIAETVKEGY